MTEVREDFASIDEMLNKINARPNNSVMICSYSSEYNDFRFSGTHSWDEALMLFRNGDVDKYKQISNELRTQSIKNTRLLPRRQIKTGVVGYAPNVPNAIMGLPNSMIYTEKVNMKSKTVSILYSMCGNVNVSSRTFIKCGVALLNVINTLELSGYRVEVRILFYNAVGYTQKMRGTVMVKRYNEHLDLLKIAFPIANPSMFRRFGFKWLETQPELTDGYYSSGYGKDNSSEEIGDKNTVYLTLDKIICEDYNSDEIIKNYFKNCK